MRLGGADGRAHAPRSQERGRASSTCSSSLTAALSSLECAAVAAIPKRLPAITIKTAQLKERGI